MQSIDISLILLSCLQNSHKQTPITGTHCEHDWNDFVTKFLRALQNCLKIRSSCDHMLTGRTDRSETVHQIMNH